MILSNNARPLPAFTLERSITDPFETRWLSWMGPWDLSLMYAYLDDDRRVDNARLFASRLDFRPTGNLELAFTLMGLLCGDGQGCGGNQFFEMLTGSGESEEYDRLASWDIRWTTRALGQPIGLYTHWVGEDFGDGNIRLIFPTKLFAQFGVETWGYWDKLGSYRIYAEWADTECDFAVLRALTFDGGGGVPGCAYWNQTYNTGQRYRGRVFGHSFDQDSSVATLGGVLVDERDRNWLATLAFGKLNRRGERISVAADNQTRYAEFEVTHVRPLWLGRLSLGLGYEYRDDEVLDEDNQDVRAFIEWRIESN